MASNASNNDVCYDSGSSQTGPFTKVVYAEEPCRFTAWGLIGDETVDVFKAVGGKSYPLMTLTADTPSTGVIVCGCITFRPNPPYAERVCVECLCGVCAGPFDGSDTQAEILECLIELKAVQQKPLIVQGLADKETCTPAWLEYPCNDAGGYDYAAGVAYTINAETNEVEEIAMSATMQPGAQPAMKTDKEDLTPLSIDGPAAAASVADIFAAALAASAVTAFSQEGSDIAIEDMAECGTFTVATKDGQGGIVLNGDTDNPLANWSDTDGVNTLNTIEVLEDCSVLVLICVKKDYVPAKGA